MNNSIKKIKLSPIRILNDYVKNKPDIINLTIGVPHFPFHQSVSEAIKESLQDRHCYYSPTKGMPETIAILAKNFELDASRVIVTAGSTAALSITFQAILNPGDEALIPTPAYPGFAPLIQLNHGKCRFVDTSDNHFIISANLLSKKITKHTKAIIINNPCNPTGVIISRQDMEDIIAFANKHNLYLVVDETYYLFDYDHKFISFKEFSYSRLIIITSLSKGLFIPGLRLGFIYASPKLIPALSICAQYQFVSASRIIQAATLSLENLSANKYYQECVNYYQQNRQLLIDFCLQCNISFIYPDGAFFLFLDISFATNAMELLEKCKIATVPGDAFLAGKNYARISFARERQMIEKAIAEMKRHYFIP